ncbi:hypothetical protein ACFPN1_08475 [Lysobacter yangpyeongensis]|uniref:Secreted protein n=1 Tax=Lysobacter yangpyeongensis TaxID=346182 RepID=A0ABW0SMW6_9GAMM
MHRRIRSFVFRPLLAGGLALVSTVHAHDTRPANFCPVGGTEMVVSQFVLTPQQLQQYRDAHIAIGETSPMECPDKSCGIVDDWYWASAMAMEQCAPMEKSLLAQGTPAPQVQWPSYFYSADHHQLYRFKAGLSGVCVVCAKPQRSTTATY